MIIDLWNSADRCFRSIEVQKNDASIAELIKAYGTIGDIEMGHVNADDIVITLLNELGYNQTVKAWHDVQKWYA